MSLLIYAMNYAPELAGVGRYTAEIVERLAAEGHDVTVVTTPPHYPEWRLRAPYVSHRWYRERAGRQTIIRCPLYLGRKMGGVWRLIAPLSFAVNSAPVVIWRILRDRPDAVFCVEPTLLGAPMALAAAWCVGAPCVLHVQDLEVDAAFAVGHLAGRPWMRSIGLFFERFCLRRFDRLITISGKMADRLQAKGVDRAKIEIVRNWVDIERIRPLDRPSAYREELGLSRGDRVALYSGSLGAKMGFGVVVAAIERLERRKDIIFIIAGQGPAKPEIELAAARLANLIVLPFQPEARMGEFLGMADVHLMPQAADAADLVLPSKLGGMLASGGPIIATAASGTEIAEFLGDSATLVPPGDCEGLARAIVEALDRGVEDGAEAKRLSLASRLSKRDGLAAIEAVVRRVLGSGDGVAKARDVNQSEAVR